MMRISSVVGVILFFMFLSAFGAQAAKSGNTKQNAAEEARAQQQFMAQCNKRRDQLLGAVCGCVMGSIQTAMPISEFNKKNNLSKEGKLGAVEMRKFSEALRGTRESMTYCLEPLQETNQ